nr:helix-turn-helix domain-containing protein [Actinomyces sp. oral taxon 849]
MELAEATAPCLVLTPAEVYSQFAQNAQLENDERAAVWECIMTVTTESRTYLPEEDVAGRFAELEAALEAFSGAALTVNGETIELPSAAAEALQQAVDAMRRGLAVTVAPQDQRLTTQEAADMLGISRSTLVRMLEAGEIPFEKVRRHRRLFLTDVLEFRERQRRAANEALSDMVTDAQAVGDYDEDPAEARKVLRDLRSQN